MQRVRTDTSTDSARSDGILGLPYRAYPMFGVVECGSVVRSTFRTTAAANRAESERQNDTVVSC